MKPHGEKKMAYTYAQYAILNQKSMGDSPSKLYSTLLDETV